MELFEFRYKDVMLCWLLRCFPWLLGGFAFSQRWYKSQTGCGAGGDTMLGSAPSEGGVVPFGVLWSCSRISSQCEHAFRAINHRITVWLGLESPIPPLPPTIPACSNLALETPRDRARICQNIYFHLNRVISMLAKKIFTVSDIICQILSKPGPNSDSQLWIEGLSQRKGHWAATLTTPLGEREEWLPVIPLALWSGNIFI